MKNKKSDKKLRKLIIIAQPSKRWFLWELQKKYIKETRKYWDTVKVIDLYKKENFQPNLSFEDMRVLNKDPNREKFQKLIKKADELVFIFPIWWGNMPAIMKNFIDTNFGAWFAYKFQKWSAIPKKLLKWKTSKIFTSCDGFKYMYNNYLCPMYIKKYIEFYILWVFWIELKQFELYDHMRKKTREEKDEILDNLSLDLKREHISGWFNKIIQNILD